MTDTIRGRDEDWQRIAGQGGKRGTVRGVRLDVSPESALPKKIVTLETALGS
jgi:hypothetical protein